MRRHSAGDASCLAALLLPHILPVCSVVAPCQPGASPPSVLRHIYEMSSSVLTACGMNPGAGAGMARREAREYREYLSAEQRRQPRGPQRGTRVGVEEGCPARESCREPRGQDTRL